MKAGTRGVKAFSLGVKSTHKVYNVAWSIYVFSYNRSKLCKLWSKLFRLSLEIYRLPVEFGKSVYMLSINVSQSHMSTLIENLIFYT